MQVESTRFLSILSFLIWYIWHHLSFSIRFKYVYIQSIKLLIRREVVSKCITTYLSQAIIFHINFNAFQKVSLCFHQILKFLLYVKEQYIINHELNVKKYFLLTCDMISICLRVMSRWKLREYKKIDKTIFWNWNNSL